jgi:hypothetical protein
METLVRFLLNALVKAGFFWLFSFIGWIAINPRDEERSTIMFIVSLVILAVLFTFVSLGVWVAYFVLTVATCGCTAIAFLLMYVLAGYFTLRLLDAWVPGMLQLNSGFWLTALMGFAVSLSYFATGKSKTVIRVDI